MAAIESGNHVLCHNLSSKAVRATTLVSMHMFLGVGNSIMTIKNVSVLWKIYKQLFKRIFRAFSVIFCVSPWDREGYCAPSTYKSLRPSFFCSLDLPQYQKSMLSNISRMDYLFWAISKWPPLKFGNHVLCLNLSSKAVRVTNLVPIHMFWGMRTSIIPIKNISVLKIIDKQLNKRIFRVFSVIFVYFIANSEKI